MQANYSEVCRIFESGNKAVLVQMERKKIGDNFDV